MNRSNNVLGLIFSNTNEGCISQLTNKRTMASVPFGGKYRLIDFPLSNMSNAGINNVGIVASSHYFSLMDHVGNGNAWDLSKRKSGLTILPPLVAKVLIMCWKLWTAFMVILKMVLKKKF